MHPYVLLISLSCLVCAACAGSIFANAPRNRPNQLAGVMLLLIAGWAMCEVGWNLSSTRERALSLVRAAALGWVFIGPLFLHLSQSAVHRPSTWVRRLLPVLYAVSAAGAGLAVLTPWVTADAVRTSWGWGYVPGPVFWPVYATIVVSVVAGLALVVRDFKHVRSPAERRQGPWLLVGTSVPLVVSSATDAVLPGLGIQVPHLATTSFALMGLLGVWTLLRFGYSFLTPGTFSHEILATLPDGVALIQGGVRIRRANDGLARLSGYPVQQLVGMSIGRLLGSDHGGDVASLLVRASVDEVECQLVDALGDRIPVSLCSAHLRDRQGFPIGVVVVVRDLREVTDLRRRLVTSARLAAVGELAAGIAHEINNPIAFVRANLTQLQGHWKVVRDEFSRHEVVGGVDELFSEGHEMIEESLEGVNRAAGIVRGVQGFSHGGSGEREPADINQLLEDVLHMAAIQLRGRVSVERIYEDLPAVYCAPQEIKQVFLNLIVNAGHAIGDDGGTIRIRSEVRAGSVCVSIEDDGCGIEPELIERIFDPFFTTKPVGDGTGLGLGIAHQIVHSHDGEISASSTPGEGSRFEVVLPVGQPDA